MISFQARARRLVFLGMILVPVIPSLVIILLGDWSVGSILRQTARDHMQRLAEDHAAMIDAFLHERLDDLRIILDEQDPGELAEPGRIQHALEGLKQLEHSFQDLGLITPEGVQVAYAGPFNLQGKKYDDSAWRKQVLSKGSYISDVYMGFRGQPHFTAAVSDRSGTVLRATIDSDAFGRLVESIRLGQHGLAYVIDSSGALQTKVRTGLGRLDVDPDFALYPAKAARTESVMVSTSAGPELFTVTPLNQGQWRLVVRQPLDDALGGLATIRLYALGLLSLGGLLIVALAFLLSRRIGAMLAATEKENRELEEQLTRAARLAELGTMTAGFAHEINNPLQVMSSDISLLEMLLSDTALADQPVPEADKEELRTILEQLRVQIGRCSKITQAVLKFGRRGQTREEIIRLNDYLPELADMVRRKAEVQGIAFDVSTNSNSPVVRADPSKLQQVLLNLLNNAIYAVVERHGSEGGELFLAAERNDSNEVVITVRDNGGGMRPDTLAMIFTPFFTTKPGDKGTGLGLPLCYGLVEGMGGSINVTSKVGEGTEFTVRLPAVGA